MRVLKRVVLVTGTPGVGKTSVSRLLASRLCAVRIDLTEVVEKEELIVGVDKLRGSLIANMDIVSRRIQEIVRNCQCDIIIDGHYAVNVVSAKANHLVFVLRRDPDELKKSMESRGYKGRKLWENLLAEVLDVCLWDAVKAYGIEKVCEIDVSGKEIDEVVRDVLLILEGKKEQRVGIVDWLGKLEDEDRLDELLKFF